MKKFAENNNHHQARKRARAALRAGELMRAADFPETTARSFPCLRMLGNAHLEVENHTGVLEFGTELIRLTTEIGILRITGNGLEIRNADRESMLVDGDIRSLQYEL